MLSSDGRFSRKPIKTNGFSMIFVDFGKQVGSQNALKIYILIDSKAKCILASIFHDFDGFWDASWGQKSIQNNIEKQYKFRCVFEASHDRVWKVRGRGASPGGALAGGGFQVPY